MKIVSGKTGTPHVTSEQFRQIIEGTVGQGSYILTSGENLEPELSSNNMLKIRGGMMSHHGNVSCVELNTYDEVTLTNGSQGVKRIDLVVNRYTRNDETGLEKNEWVVIIGTPDATNPKVPQHTIGNLQNGDLIDDCPVFEVHYDGINVTEVKKLLPVMSNLDLLNGKLPCEGESYIKFPDGTLIQWGKVESPKDGPSHGIIDFTVPFLNKNYSVLATPIYPNANIPTFTVSIDKNATDKATAYFRTNNSGNLTGAFASWFAIGRWK